MLMAKSGRVESREMSRIVVFAFPLVLVVGQGLCGADLGCAIVKCLLVKCLRSLF